MAARILNNGISLTVSHDFLSFRANGWTLTAGRSGEKSTGGVPSAVFTAFNGAVSGYKYGVTPGTFEDHLVAWFQNELPKVWPAFNTKVAEPVLGMKVQMNLGGRRGVQTGEVVKLAPRKNGRHNVRFPGGLFAMTSLEIAACA